VRGQDAFDGFNVVSCESEILSENEKNGKLPAPQSGVNNSLMDFLGLILCLEFFFVFFKELVL
jgi:hypothetical protein